jgi:hypothetical protein
VADWPAEYGYRNHDYSDQLTMMPFWQAKAKRRRWWRPRLLIVKDWRRA